MHQSFTDTYTLVKWFFNNFCVFDDRFSVLSIPCVAQELCARFLYKCPASRSDSLQQHGLLVAQLTAECRYILQRAAPSPLK